MKHKIRNTALVVALAVLCGAWACNSHDINRGNKQISDDISQVQQTSQQLFNSGQIDVDDFKALQNFAIEAADDHKILTSGLRALPDYKGANAAQAIALVQQFVDKVHGANLHLKSKDAQNAANLFFTTFDAAIATIENGLGAKPKSQIPDDRPLKAGGTADEIALALAAFGSLWRLLAQWKADGSLTDQQLQDAADAEDDETKKAALAALTAVK